MALSFNAERAMYWLSLEENASQQQIPSNLMTAREQRRAYLELREQELIQDAEDSDGSFSFVLKPAGELAGHQIQDVYRNSLAQVRILEWLDSTKNAGAVSDILNTEFAQDFSGPLALADIEQAATELEEAKMITVLNSFGGTQLRPCLTEKGSKLRMQKMSLNDATSTNTPNITSFNTVNHGQIGNQNVGGTNVRMEAHDNINNSGLNADELTEILSKLREILESAKIDESKVEDLRTDLSHIEKQSPKKSLRWIGSMLSTFIDDVIGVAGTETGQAMLEAVQPYIQAN